VLRCVAVCCSPLACVAVCWNGDLSVGPMDLKLPAGPIYLEIPTWIKPLTPTQNFEYFSEIPYVREGQNSV